MTKEKEVNLFTYLNQIQSKRRTHDYDKKIANSYLLSLFLSMDKDFIKHVDDINKYLFILPDEIIYEYYMKIIPQGRKYIKFIKKRKGDSKFNERVEKIRKLYPELSLKEAKMAITSLQRRTNEN